MAPAALPPSGVVGLVGRLLGSVFLAGVVVSNAAFLGALYLLARLASVDGGRPQDAAAAATLACVYPMSLFCSALYSALERQNR